MSFGSSSFTPKSRPRRNVPLHPEDDDSARFLPGYGAVLFKQMKVTAPKIVAKAHAATSAAAAVAAKKLTPKAQKRTAAAKTAVSVSGVPVDLPVGLPVSPRVVLPKDLLVGVPVTEEAHAATAGTATADSMATSQPAAMRQTFRARRHSADPEAAAGAADASLYRGGEVGDQKAAAFRSLKKSFAAAQHAGEKSFAAAQHAVAPAIENALDWLYDRGVHEEIHPADAAEIQVETRGLVRGSCEEIPEADAAEIQIEASGLVVNAEEFVEWDACAERDLGCRQPRRSNDQGPAGGECRRWGRRSASLTPVKDSVGNTNHPGSAEHFREQPVRRWCSAPSEEAGQLPNMEDDYATDVDELLGPALLPDENSWDWPLSRHEKKTRVQMIEDHMHEIDQARLLRELAGLRRKVRRLSGQLTASGPCVDKPLEMPAQPLPQTDVSSEADKPLEIPAQLLPQTDVSNAADELLEMQALPLVHTDAPSVADQPLEMLAQLQPQTDAPRAADMLLEMPARPLPQADAPSAADEPLEVLAGPLPQTDAPSAADEPLEMPARQLPQTDAPSAATHVAPVPFSEATAPVTLPEACSKQMPRPLRDPHVQMQEKMERVRQRMEGTAAAA